MTRVLSDASTNLEKSAGLPRRGPSIHSPAPRSSTHRPHCTQSSLPPLGLGQKRGDPVLGVGVILLRRVAPVDGVGVRRLLREGEVHRALVGEHVDVVPARAPHVDQAERRGRARRSRRAGPSARTSGSSSHGSLLSARGSWCPRRAIDHAVERAASTPPASRSARCRARAARSRRRAPCTPASARRGERCEPRAPRRAARTPFWTRNTVTSWPRAPSALAVSATNAGVGRVEGVERFDEHVLAGHG